MLPFTWSFGERLKEVESRIPLKDYASLEDKIFVLLKAVDI